VAAQGAVERGRGRDKEGGGPITDARRTLHVTGDAGVEAYTYMNSLSETPPNLREARVDATQRGWTASSPGTAQTS